MFGTIVSAWVHQLYLICSCSDPDHINVQINVCVYQLSSQDQCWVQQLIDSCNNQFDPRWTSKGPFSLKKNFPRTENFPKISLLKVETTSKFFSDGKFVSANHISQIFLSAENFLEWKWALRGTVQDRYNIYYKLCLWCYLYSECASTSLAWPRWEANFSACPVWMHTQSNITNIIFTWVHNTNTHTK
jgi:hypothetical protein